ncbi:MAG: hypothetical protein HRU70_12540 [Phycisphaeraceae bacterium]|nr:MAG: hypothetical protein HRU70_12540 [Phycisphaeraceae bacterium]
MSTFVSARALQPEPLDSPDPAPAAAPTARPTRVSLVLLAVAMVSLLDLDLTLHYAGTTGMIEHNPIARELLATGSVGLVVLWKVLTAGLAIGILYAHRRHRSAELGAWLCLAIMLWLTARWVHFNSEVSLLACPEFREAVSADPRWVVLAKE